MVAGFPPLLVVDDDPIWARSFCRACVGSTLDRVVVHSKADAMDAISRQSEWLLLVFDIDIDLDPTAGFQLFAAARDRGITAPALLVTGHSLDTCRGFANSVAGGSVWLATKPLEPAHGMAFVLAALLRWRDVPECYAAAAGQIIAEADFTPAQAQYFVLVVVAEDSEQEYMRVRGCGKYAKDETRAAVAKRSGCGTIAALRAKLRKLALGRERLRASQGGGSDAASALYEAARAMGTGRP